MNAHMIFGVIAIICFLAALLDYPWSVRAIAAGLLFLTVALLVP